MVRDAEYYVNYVNQWMEENKNKGCGCTYWHAMYDAIRNWWISFEWLWGVGWVGRFRYIEWILN